MDRSRQTMTTTATIRRTDATVLYALDHEGPPASEDLADRAPASASDASVADGRTRRLAAAGFVDAGADGRVEARCR